MRWVTKGLAVLALLWAAYFVSPYAALYALGRAASRHDAAALSARIELQELRQSVARQLIAAYLKATGRESELGRSSGQLTLQVGAWIADPIVAEYVSPERILALLGSAPGEGTTPIALGRIGLGSPADAWDLVRATERRGFSKVEFRLPLRQPREAGYGLLFRLSGLGWKLAGVDLPAGVEQRLVREMMKKPVGI